MLSVIYPRIALNQDLPTGTARRKHHSVSKRSRVIAASALLLAYSTSTYASSAGSLEDNDLDEVIVTATQVISSSLKDQNGSGSRLGIPALDIPASVAAISSEAMEVRGDINMMDAVSHASGIDVQPTSGSGGYGFAVRGFGSSSVTILYDGTKSLINTGSMTYPYDTWNVQRIEVLNGPASVLYGGGAIGAAINVIPRKPSTTAEHTVRLAAGSFSTYRAALDSTGELTDKLLYQFDASNTTSAGYVQRGDSRTTAVSGALSYLATDTLGFTLSADYADRHQWIYMGMPLINGVANEALRSINYATYDSAIPFEDSRVTLETNWQPSEAIKFHNSAYYLYGQRLWRYPSQFVYRPLTNDVLRRGFGTYLQYQNQMGDHAELTWKHRLFGLDNTLSTGVDITTLQNKRLVDTYSGTDVLDLYNSSPGQFPSGAPTKNYQQSDADQYSVFAEDRLMVLPSLSLITGVRADHVATTRTNLLDNSKAERTYKPVSWRTGVVYEVAPQLNVYGQYSTAVDPVSNLCCISAAQLAFDMSKGKQTEIGIKQIVWDNRIEWTLAGYRIVKNKLLTPDPTNLALSIQVGQQSSRGVEASLAFTPSMDWRIEANGTVLKAKYDDFTESVSGVRVSRNGNRPVNIPQRLASLWTIWTFVPRWQAQVGVQYHGDMYANSDNTQRVPAYTVVDAGLRWTADKNMIIDLRASNVLDRFYAYGTGGNGSNGGQWLVGAPRSFEIAWTAKF
ncbi:MAG: TonB-dependent siderophore receptor [Steroidobacteraceae bacterium]